MQYLVNMTTGTRKGENVNLPQWRLEAVNPRYSLGDRVYIAVKAVPIDFHWSAMQDRCVGQYGTVREVYEREFGYVYVVRPDNPPVSHWLYPEASLRPEAEAKINLLVNGEDYYTRKPLSAAGVLAEAYGAKVGTGRLTCSAPSYQEIPKTPPKPSYVLITQGQQAFTTKHADESAARAWLTENGDADTEYKLHAVTELATVRVKRNTTLEPV
jgi:hypothetical protein